MIEELDPELFTWELYNSSGPFELSDALYVADSFGYCDASRLTVRPRPGEYALMVEWPTGEKYWFHVPPRLLEIVKRRLQKREANKEGK